MLDTYEEAINRLIEKHNTLRVSNIVQANKDISKNTKVIESLSLENKLLRECVALNKKGMGKAVLHTNCMEYISNYNEEVDKITPALSKNKPMFIK